METRIKAGIRTGNVKTTSGTVHQIFSDDNTFVRTECGLVVFISKYQTRTDEEVTCNRCKKYVLGNRRRLKR